jgi:hypothetical protein
MNERSEGIQSYFNVTLRNFSVQMIGRRRNEATPLGDLEGDLGIGTSPEKTS